MRVFRYSHQYTTVTIKNVNCELRLVLARNNFSFFSSLSFNLQREPRYSSHTEAREKRIRFVHQGTFGNFLVHPSEFPGCGDAWLSRWNKNNFQLTVPYISRCWPGRRAGFIAGNFRRSDNSVGVAGEAPVPVVET